MARTSTARRSLVGIEGRAVGRGALAGLLAGVGMGLVLQFGTGILPVLGAFVGEASVLRGWLVHLAIAAAYGAGFAAVVAYPAIADFLDARGVREYALVGTTYATMIAALSIAVLPFVFSLPWTPGVTWGAAGAGRPNVTLVSAGLFAAAHLVYGVLLGAAYVLLTDGEG